MFYRLRVSTDPANKGNSARAGPAPDFPAQASPAPGPKKTKSPPPGRPRSDP